jgi:hypothetical protein
VGGCRNITDGGYLCVLIFDHRLGSWTGDQIPWSSFWAFLLASIAGNLQDTLLLAIKVARDGDKLSLILFRSVLDFLVSKDDQVSPQIVTALKDALASFQE